MAKTAIIYDVTYDRDIYEGQFLFFETYSNWRKYEFNIQYPDNTEENIEYGDCKKKDSDYPKPISLVREKCLQRIVNKMENDGYKVRPDQLALFMRGKIDKLIMQKNN
jgi:hypothetical protein